MYYIHVLLYIITADCRLSEQECNFSVNVPLSQQHDWSGRSQCHQINFDDREDQEKQLLRSNIRLLSTLIILFDYSIEFEFYYRHYYTIIFIYKKIITQSTSKKCTRIF